MPYLITSSDGSHFLVKDELKGKKVKCPKTGEIHEVGGATSQLLTPEQAQAFNKKKQVESASAAPAAAPTEDDANASVGTDPELKEDKLIFVNPLTKKKMAVAPSMAGKKIRCPQTKKLLVVPELPAEAPTSEAPMETAPAVSEEPMAEAVASTENAAPVEDAAPTEDAAPAAEGASPEAEKKKMGAPVHKKALKPKLRGGKEAAAAHHGAAIEAVRGTLKERIAKKEASLKESKVRKIIVLSIVGALLLFVIYCFSFIQKSKYITKDAGEQKANGELDEKTSAVAPAKTTVPEPAKTVTAPAKTAEAEPKKTE